MVKGDYDCICDCCIYWRRHIHRVAANRDKAAGQARSGRDWYKTMYEGQSKTIRCLYDRIRDQDSRISKLQKELEGRSVIAKMFNWIFGG